jgi:hypothetical protein
MGPTAAPPTLKKQERNPQVMRLSPSQRVLAAAVLLASASVGSQLFAHGNVTPQPVDTTALPEIGDAWLQHNPYRGNAKAAEIGESAFGQNCARKGISKGFP